MAWAPQSSARARWHLSLKVAGDTNRYHILFCSTWTTLEQYHTWTIQDSSDCMQCMLWKAGHIVRVSCSHSLNIN